MNKLSKAEVLGDLDEHVSTTAYSRAVNGGSAFAEAAGMCEDPDAKNLKFCVTLFDWFNPSSGYDDALKMYSKMFDVDVDTAAAAAMEFSTQEIRNTIEFKTAEKYFPQFESSEDYTQIGKQYGFIYGMLKTSCQGEIE